MNVDDTLKFSASAALGELQRALKVYESFKDAEKVLQVLAEQERHQTVLDRETKRMEEHLEWLKEQTGEELRKQDEVYDKVKKMESDATIRVKEAESKANEHLSKARDEAKAIVSKANSDIEYLKIDIENLKKEKSKAVTETEEARRMLDEISRQIDQKKKEILKVFG